MQTKSFVAILLCAVLFITISYGAYQFGSSSGYSSGYSLGFDRGQKMNTYNGSPHGFTGQNQTGATG